MRPRGSIPPLEPRPKPPTVFGRIPIADAIAEVRAHVPTLEAELQARVPEFSLDHLLTEPLAHAALAGLLVATAREELTRRQRIAASILSRHPVLDHDVTRFERFAIQEEGAPSHVENSRAARPSAEEADPMARPRGLPGRTSPT